MKRILILTLTLGTLIIASNALAQGATSPDIFWLHGSHYGAFPSQMYRIGDLMQTAPYFPNSRNPQFPGYNALQTSLSTHYTEVNGELSSPVVGYIGVGYSEGGLVARGVATLHSPAPPNPFIRGLVTMDSPNQGVQIASCSEIQAFESAWTAALAEVKNNGNTDGLSQFDPIGFYKQLGLNDASLICGLGDIPDLVIGSSAINSLNSSANQAQEAILLNGRALVWSLVTGRTLPAYNWEQSGVWTTYNFPQAQAAYQALIDVANNNAAVWHSAAQADLKAFMLTFPIWFSKSSMAIYTAFMNASALYSSNHMVAQGYADANNAWEAHTGKVSFQVSIGGCVTTLEGIGSTDAFISVFSQQGWPGVSSDRMFQSEGDASTGRVNESNHGRVIVGDADQATKRALQKVNFN